MDGTDEEVVERMRYARLRLAPMITLTLLSTLECRENADAFEIMTDNTDDRVNDGNNYRGLMKASEYKAKRDAIVAGNISEDTIAERKLAAAALALKKDRDAKEQALKEREQREANRREKLKRELEGLAEPEALGIKPTKGSKRKKKEVSALSFDFDDEG